MSKKLILMGIVAVVVLGIAGAAVAGVSVSSGGQQQAIARVALSDIGALATFKRSNVFTAAETASLSDLRSQLNSSPSDGLAGHVDLSSARPFGIPGGEGYVWIAKTTDGGICEFMPQLAPGEASGYSSGCSTLQDFNQSGLVALNYGKNNDFVTVAVQPDGVTAPVVKSIDGGSTTIPVSSNVAVGTLKAGEAVTSGGLTLSTDTLTKLPAPPHVTPPQ